MSREPADYDNEQPKCDHCGSPQWREGDDWNPETGCHLTCEEANARGFRRFTLPEGPGLATQTDIDIINDRLRAAMAEGR